MQATLYLLTPPSHFLHTLFTLCRTHFSPPSPIPHTVQATLYLLTPPSHFLHTLFTLCRTHSSPPSQFLTLYKPHYIYLHLLHTFSTRFSHCRTHFSPSLHFFTPQMSHFSYTSFTPFSHSEGHAVVHLHGELRVFGHGHFYGSHVLWVCVGRWVMWESVTTNAC